MAKKLYTVHYEGWAVVLADSEEEALDLTNDLVSRGELHNNGIDGEWELTSVEISEDW